MALKFNIDGKFVVEKYSKLFPVYRHIINTFIYIFSVRKINVSIPHPKSAH